MQYLFLAKEFAQWSKDPNRKVGAIVIGDHGQLLSQGYNGFPRNYPDLEKNYNNKAEKNKYIIHAEKNCIYHAALTSVSLSGSSMFVYGLPVCHECAKGIIQVNIKQVFVYVQGPYNTKWNKSFELAEDLFKKSNIIYTKIS